jgi:hypothetical protein
MKKKVKRKIKKKTVSYWSKVSDLYRQIEKLESVEYLYEYFAPLKKKRNSFIVEMRRVVAEELDKQGFNLTDISLILSKNHATILHLKTTIASDYVAQEVITNYKQWIEDKVYPQSCVIYETSYLHTQGFKHTTTYKLEPI